MTHRLRSYLLFIGAMTMAGCGGAPDMPPPSAGVPFASVYGPILQPSCASCHYSRTAQQTTFYLDDAASAYKVLMGDQPSLSKLPYVTPGDPSKSFLYLKLTGDPTAGARMPLGSPALPDAQLEAISNWITQGAQD